MRTGVVVLALIGAIGIGALVSWLAKTPAPIDRPASYRDSDASGHAARIDALEATLKTLRLEVAALREATERVRTPAPREFTIPTPTADASTPASAPNPSAHRYLSMYVASFENGGTGSEYFRLAVDAWAMELLDRIADLVRDGHRPFALRSALLAMLSTPRFRGNPTAIQAVMAAMRAGPDEITSQGTDAIEEIGSATDLPELERLFAALSPVAIDGFLDAIAIIAGDEASATFLRLLHAARDLPTRVKIIQRFAASDVATTLKILRAASHGEVAERRAAADRLAQFFDAPYRRFADEWLARERDPGVREALGASRRAMDTIPNHHPLQATGAPNVDDPSKDDVRAWATQQSDSGHEWLEVMFARAMRASAIHVHETHRAGAVAEVITIDETGTRRRVWQGVDPTAGSGVFVVPMTVTEYRVKGVRVVLDTRRVASFNEVDAVELVGPDDRAWAASARASSWYGEGRGGRRWR